MTAFLLALALQTDSELTEFRKLAWERAKHRVAGDTAKAEQIEGRMRALLHAALGDHDAALKANDMRLSEDTFVRVAEMVKWLTWGPLLFVDEEDSRKAFLPYAELIKVNEQGRKKESEAACRSTSQLLAKMGAPAGFQSILPRPLKPEEDATALYIQYFRRARETKERCPDTEAFFDVRDCAEAAAKPALAKTFLEGYGPLLPLLRDATRTGKARFRTDWEQADGRTPYRSDLIRTAKTLRACALAYGTWGDHESAREAFSLQLALAQCNSDEPLLVSALIDVVLLDIAAETLEEAFAASLPSVEAIKSWRITLAGFDARSRFRRAFQGDACLSVLAFEKTLLPSLEGSARRMELATVFRRDVNRLLAFYGRVCSTLDQNDAAVRRLLTTEPDKAEVPLLMGYSGPLLQRSLKNMVSMETRVRMLRIALAATEYRRLHGSNPVRLEDLVPEHLDQVPEDPFTGRAFEYAGGAIRSPGLDEGESDDVVFKLP